jgi:recombination protein RecA
MANLTREQIMKQAMAAIKKACPDSVIGKYDEIGQDVDIKRISTGSLAVDAALGGGFPKGKIIDIVGKTSSGKTTLALTCCATLQKEDPNANILYVDAEAALDPSYAAALGVDLNKIFLCQPDCGESGFTAAEMFIASGVADLVVIDSIASMIPKSVLDSDVGKDVQIGSYARLIGRGLSKINAIASKNKCTVILINQWKPAVRANMYAAVGGLGGSMYQPGGEALPFLCSQILEVARVSTVKDTAGNIISSITKMNCKKNKVAPPYRSAEFVITYGKGLDKTQEILGLGLSLGLIKKAGAFYTIPGIYEKNIQGRARLVEVLDGNKDVLDKLEDLVRQKIAGAKDIVLEKGENAEIDTEGLEEINEVISSEEE